MDTKPLELETETLVQHQLIRNGFKVTKPNFDSDGADLLVVDDINAKFTKLIKVQCKGRTLTKSARVEVAKSYVTKNFILFLYLKDEDNSKPLHLFTHEDIVQWETNQNKYVLNIARSCYKRGDLRNYEFTSNSSEKINQILKEAEIKKYSSLLVEEAFIDKAISKTMQIYKKMYPGRVFNKPSTNEVIQGILSVYDEFSTPEIPVKCYVFFKDNQRNNQGLDFSRMYTDRNIEVKIYREKTSRDISTEVLEHLSRIVNSENVMLAVDDYVYEEPLTRLKDKGVDVILVQFSSSEGRQIYTEHMWGDVVYAVAQALGLHREEW